MVPAHNERHSLEIGAAKKSPHTPVCKVRLARWAALKSQETVTENRKIKRENLKANIPNMVHRPPRPTKEVVMSKFYTSTLVRKLQNPKAKVALKLESPRATSVRKLQNPKARSTSVRKLQNPKARAALKLESPRAI